jgi:hypothetical protein
MRKAVIVDVDGTVALMGKGEPGRRGPYDWHRVGEDDPNRPVINLVEMFRDDDCHIIFVSGRDESCRLATQHWLIQHDVAMTFLPDGDLLYMRPAGDNRGDDEIKLEIYKRDIEPRWNVVYVLDDRDRVIKMWRSLGLTVLQVADGSF